MSLPKGRTSHLRVVTPPNNWDQLQNIRTFYQPLDFNLLNQQLAEANLSTSDSSDSSDTEDEMANTIINYLEDNLYNYTSLRIDLFYGDGTQDPFQWMIHFEKVARTDWATWKARFAEKYCNTRWKNKWMRETIDAYYVRFKRLVKRVEINVDQHKRLFIKGLLPHIAPLVTMQAPATLAVALEKVQAYKEGLDMINKIEPRKRKGKKKVVESSNKEDEEEEEERKPKKTVLKKKKKETKVTFNPAHNLDDLAKKFEKMQLNLIQKMENNNRETRTCFKCGKEGHIFWDCSDRKDNSDNSAHAKLVEVEEESEKEEDKFLQYLLDAYDAYLGKRERDDSSDEDTPIKRPRETNIPESKLSLNTFGLPKTTSVPVLKVVKTEITPKKKSKKKEEKGFDIVEQLQNQPAGLSWANALEVPSIRKSFFEALRKPKEKEIKLADQEYSLKTTALKCNVAVGVYTVPTIVDSGAAISIVTRDAIEQLGYEIEEASKSIILPATGKKTQPLGVIRDLPITIQGQTIPIDIEKTKEEFSELIENTDEESTNESDTETEESEEIIFKNTTIEDDDDENDKDTVSVFLSEKLNKNELDIGEAKPIKQRFYRTHSDKDQFIKEELDSSVPILNPINPDESYNPDGSYNPNLFILKRIYPK
ncbi:hypothetical protein Glove_203g75 [Diversispora epigaea]|uniref:CCHC-type domain-containing protein n=1 Tax=Diversispora epigaea TaxID=1348612 RepID=A0A397IMQ5_9GLOM|nr:hypothetical protein Glove_203g75 [Diversispora epigaea]